MRAPLLCLAAVSLALTGCGEPEQAHDMSPEEVADELADVRIDPGLWEMTSEVLDVRAPNLPREVYTNMVGPRSTVRHCISPEQAAEPSANFLAGQANSDCTYRDFAMENGRLRGTMTCLGADGTRVNAVMDGRYQPQRYEMRMRMQSPMPGGVTMTLQIRNAGRRVGECAERTSEEED